MLFVVLLIRDPHSIIPSHQGWFKGDGCLHPPQLESEFGKLAFLTGTAGGAPGALRMRASSPRSHFPPTSNACRLCCQRPQPPSPPVPEIQRNSPLFGGLSLSCPSLGAPFLTVWVCSQAEGLLVGGLVLGRGGSTCLCCTGNYRRGEEGLGTQLTVAKGAPGKCGRWVHQGSGLINGWEPHVGKDPAGTEA